MKLFRTLTIAAIVCLILPAFVFAGSLNQANRFLEKGELKLAVLETDQLTVNAPNSYQDAEAWYIRGQAFLKQGRTQAGLNAIEEAVRIDPAKYAPELKRSLMEAATNAPPEQTQAILQIANRYFMAPDVQAVQNNLLKQYQELAKQKLAQNQLDAAKSYHNVILRLDPGQKLDIYVQVLNLAKSKADNECLPYYEYAASICEQDCPEATEAGKRLKAIADQLFQKNVFDPKVEKYRAVAGKFIEIKPLVRIYPPNVNPKVPYTFEFAQAGERMDHWIGSPPNMDVLDAMYPNNRNYKIYLRQSGIVVDRSKGEKIPKSAYNDDMLFESTGPTAIRLLRKKTLI